MSRKSIGITLLAVGSLCMIGGIASIGWGINRMVSSFRTIATFEAPATAPVTIGNPGKVTLWHDHETIHNGTTVRHPSALPGGFSFELIDPVRGPQSMTSGSSTTMSSGSTSRVALGSFEIPDAGPYEIKIEGPEPRVFSVTEGGSMAGVGGFIGGMGVGMLGGMVGFALLIAGVIVLLVGKRKPPVPPRSPA